MARFRKNILVGEEEMSFSFTQLKYPDGVGYFVTVSDKDKNIYSFDLKQVVKNEWQIVRKATLPSWITNAEHELSNIVNEAKAKSFALSD